MRDRLSGMPSRSSFDDSPSQRDSAPAPARRPRPTNGEDSELAAAIEASKRSAEQDAARQKQEGQGDRDLEEAMRLSREEEERRKREQDAQAQNALFDDAFQKYVWFCLLQLQDDGADALCVCKPDSDGPNAYNQNNLLIDVGGAQPTGLQPQFTSYNPYAQQQQQQAQQEEWLRQQAAQEEWLRQQQQQQQVSEPVVISPSSDRCI
jgi:epsin